MKIKNVLNHIENYRTDFVNNHVWDYEVKKICHIKEAEENTDSDVIYYGKSKDFIQRISGKVIISDTPVTCQYGCECNFIIVKEESLDSIKKIIEELLENEHKLIMYKNEMFEELLGKSDLNRILEISFKYLENPIIITDSRYRLVNLYPDKKLNEPVWDTIRDKGYADQELMNQIESDHTKEETFKRNFPFYLDWGFAQNFRRIARKISDGNRFFGVIGVLESYENFERIDLEIVECLSMTIRNIILSTNPPTDESTSYKQTLLSNLIEGDVYDDKKLKSAFKIGNLKWNPPYRMVNIPFDMNNFNLSILRSLQDEILSNIKSAQSTVNASNIVLLFYGEDIYESIEKINLILEKYKFDCGISDEFFDLTEAGVFYEQGKAAYRLGVNRENKKTHYYNDFFEEHFIKTINNRLDSKIFIYPGIYKLIAYDNEHQTNYAKTLEIYLDCYKNINEVSSLMHIHRNTLNYRLKKIEELLEISLDDNKLCRHIHISMQILGNKKSVG